jgi:hypothetical protein
MAKIEKDEYGEDFFNVASAVGYQPANNYTNDIIIVQALLKYINEGAKWWADSKLPVPNGALGNLGQIVSEYQGRIRKQTKVNGYWVAQDGRVSPSTDGKHSFPGGGRYTIMQLNGHAAMVGVALGHKKHYIEEIFDRWKVVRYALSSSTRPLPLP